MQERYYKSRAAFLARCTSIVSASITTLCAVMPLLWAKMLPLRQFGIIFTLVAVLSLFFSIGFFGTLMMLFGSGKPLEPPAKPAAPPGRWELKTISGTNASQSSRKGPQVFELAKTELAPCGGLEVLETEASRV
jgi:hypothetical protein